MQTLTTWFWNSCGNIRDQNSQSNLVDKKNTLGRVKLPEFKTYYKGKRYHSQTVPLTYLWTHRTIKQNWESRNKPSHYVKWFGVRVPRPFDRKRIIFWINDAEQLDININSERIIDLHVTANTMKLLERITGINLHSFGLGNEFSNTTSKQKKKGLHQN